MQNDIFTLVMLETALHGMLLFVVICNSASFICIYTRLFTETHIGTVNNDTLLISLQT